MYCTLRETDCKISRVFAECMANRLGEFALSHQTVMLSFVPAEREWSKFVVVVKGCLEARHFASSAFFEGVFDFA